MRYAWLDEPIAKSEQPMNQMLIKSTPRCE